MGNVPLQKLVGKGKENKLTKFQRQKLKYDFDTFFGKNLFVSTIFLCTRAYRVYSQHCNCKREIV